MSLRWRALSTQVRERRQTSRVPAAAHARQLKVAIRSDRPAGARKSVPQGHLIVAHYEVVGNGVALS
jgi:hypothetical protein